MIECLAAGVIVAVLTEPVREYALRRGVVDRPRAERAHLRATPHLGGVAIVIGVVAAAFLTGAAEDRPSATILFGAVAVACLGLADDLRQLTPLARLVTEAAVACVVVLAGVRIDLFGNGLDAAATVVWIVIITNAFNLLDNSDGVAGIVAATTATVLGAAALSVGRIGLGLLMLAVATGSLGFLVHNWPPARIFMGDCGSLFLGFTLAASAVSIAAPAGGASTPAALLLVTFVATVDTAVVIVARERIGRSWLSGGRDHVAHRLRCIGAGPSQTCVLFGGAAAITSLFGVFTAAGLVPGLASLAATAGLGIALVALLQRAPYPAHPARATAMSGGARAAR